MCIRDRVKAFVDEYGITYPVLMDTTGQLFSSFGVSSFPTTFMIDKDGYVFDYAPGMLTADVMDSIVEMCIRDSFAPKKRRRVLPPPKNRTPIFTEATKPL